MMSSSNINNILLVLPSYYSGQAAGNRMMAYAKEYAKLGKKVYLVLGASDNFDLPTIEGVEVKSVVDSSRNSLYKKIAKVVTELYNDDSAIHLYGTPFLMRYLSPKKYNFFIEFTEVPFYGRKHGLRASITEWYKLHLAKKAKGLFVISQSLFDYYKSKGLKNIEVINMFVDGARFDSVINMEDRKKIITYCGTISPEKDGVNILLKAFKLVLKRHPDYTLQIVGKGETEALKREMENLSIELGISESVIFTGLVPFEEMPKLLIESEILALARPNNAFAKYGFPTKLGEYLCTGNPVVVTRVGEIGQFLTDKYNCIFAQPNNIEDFADKICWAIEHREECKRIGKEGREVSLTEFSSYQQTAKALAFIESIKLSI